jgi:hypothetical protein
VRGRCSIEILRQLELDLLLQEMKLSSASLRFGPESSL